MPPTKDEKCGAHDLLVELVKKLIEKVDRMKMWVVIAAAAGSMGGGALPSCKALPFLIDSASACVSVEATKLDDTEGDTETYFEFTPDDDDECEDEEAEACE